MSSTAVTSTEAKTAASLFAPISLGALQLKHRVVLAPLTRLRPDQPGSVPNDLMATYYQQRASDGGLLITEATVISEGGQGYPFAPGVYSTAQVSGWRKVTDAVHAKGGQIFCQVWHVGRVSHSSFQPDGRHAPAPSAVAIPEGKGNTAGGTSEPYQTPRAMTALEIKAMVAAYRQAALNAKAAGFDGVEVHGANGYLIDQFLQNNVNKRTDNYGGSTANRYRFLAEVLEAVIPVFGAERTGLRLSPWGTFGSMHDSDKDGLFTYVLQQLNALGLAYLHIVSPRVNGASDSKDGPELTAVTQLKESSGYAGPIILAGGFKRQGGIDAVAHGMADAVAYGRYFISNPDLPLRLRINAPLNPYDRSTFYGGDHTGYTDHPALTEDEVKQYTEASAITEPTPAATADA